MLEAAHRKSREELTPVERSFLAWASLLDFGFEFCLQTFHQDRPGEDPLERLRRAYRRKSIEHQSSNESMLRNLQEPHGQRDRAGRDA